MFADNKQATQIDPYERRFVSRRCRPDELDTVITDWVGPDPARGDLPDSDRQYVWANHYLWVPRTPEPNAPSFWFDGYDRHPKPIEFKGRAILMAQRPDGKVFPVPGTRMTLNSLSNCFKFDEPDMHTPNLELARMFKPAREAMGKLVEAIEKQPPRPDMLDIKWEFAHGDPRAGNLVAAFYGSRPDRR